jgi:hypothetical protein
MVRALVLVAIACSCSAPQLHVVPLPELATYRKPDEITPALDRLRATLARFELALDDAPELSTCDDPTGPDCTTCTTVTATTTRPAHEIDRLALAVARYPKLLYEVAGVKRLAVCERLDGRDEVDPVGLADFNHERILISLDTQLDGAFDHELMHFIDRGTSLHDPFRTQLPDTDWRKLNPPSFHYDGVGHHEHPGFITAYATASEIEDRAETFRMLMVDPVTTCAIAARDAIVAAKVRSIYQRITRITGDAYLRERAGCAAPGS